MKISSKQIFELSLYKL